MSKLDINVQGKMNRYHLGELSDDLKKELEMLIPKLDIGSTVEDALSNLLFNDLDESLGPIDDKELSNKFSLLSEVKNLGGTLFDELKIFFQPMVIDEDNHIEIKYDDKIVFKGTVESMLEGTESIEVMYEDVKIDTDRIRNEKIISDKVIEHKWGDMIKFSDNQSFLDSILMEGDASFSKNGWLIGDDVIKNKTYERKVEGVEYEKRLSVIEYGNYHIKYCLNDIKDFDLKKLIWHFDYGLYEYRDKYMFSNVFIADINGIYKLDEHIENNDQKSLTVEYDWPIDG